MRMVISSNTTMLMVKRNLVVAPPVLCEILWNMGHSACELVASRFLNPTVLYALAAIQFQSIHTSFLKLYRGK